MKAQTVPEYVAQTRPEPEHDVEKVSPTEDIRNPSKEKPNSDDEGKQAGVKKIEATASVWYRKMLWVIFAMYFQRKAKNKRGHKLMASTPGSTSSRSSICYYRLSSPSWCPT